MKPLTQIGGKKNMKNAKAFRRQVPLQPRQICWNSAFSARSSSSSTGWVDMFDAFFQTNIIELFGHLDDCFLSLPSCCALPSFASCLIGPPFSLFLGTHPTLLGIASVLCGLCAARVRRRELLGDPLFRHSSFLRGSRMFNLFGSL